MVKQVVDLLSQLAGIGLVPQGLQSAAVLVGDGVGSTQAVEGGLGLVNSFLISRL